MRTTSFILAVFLLVWPSAVKAQNCCAPAVPQLGVLGETVALPHTLEVGFHYEYLRSYGLYDGSEEIDDPADTKTIWKRATLAVSYGLLERLSVSAIMPYTWKEKTKNLIDGTSSKNSSAGFGDLTVLFRYSLLPRSYVTFRELTLGLGVKLPTGSTGKRNYGVLLSEELQPGTGTWDFNASAAFYQGYETVDFIVSGTYLLTTTYENTEREYKYKFGNQFSYLVTANFHPHQRLDLTASLTGIVRGKDKVDGEPVCATGRRQLWFSPGVQFAIIPNYLRLQFFYELPLYQRFNGVQLGSDYNLRISLAGLLPLKSSGDD
ncbi:MAG: transporter [candidate division Zixibacteria bacterium]|nr:transporter [candidate division Zixibacteria bacterium]